MLLHICSALGSREPLGNRQTCPAAAILTAEGPAAEATPSETRRRSARGEGATTGAARAARQVPPLVGPASSSRSLVHDEALDLVRHPNAISSSPTRRTNLRTFIPRLDLSSRRMLRTGPLGIPAVPLREGLPGRRRPTVSRMGTSARTRPIYRNFQGFSGAGSGNRTRAKSLEGSCDTISPYPRESPVSMERPAPQGTLHPFPARHGPSTFSASRRRGT